MDIRNRDGITPLDWALRNGNREVAEFLIGNGAKTGSSQAATATTARHSDRKLQDLKHYSRLKPILARQQPLRPAALAEPESINVQDPQTHPQTGAFRIQLAAVGTHERALKAWNRYSRQYPDILDGRELFVVPVHVSGKTLYRIQAGNFTKRTASSVCKQLTDGSQPCLIINADPLWLAEQGKPAHP